METNSSASGVAVTTVGGGAAGHQEASETFYASLETEAPAQFPAYNCDISPVPLIQCSGSELRYLLSGTLASNCVLFSVCGGVGDQCYCAQMSGLSGHGGWEAAGHWQPQEAGPSHGLVNNNVNMAADSYIRQFEEAYSASYSNISSSPSGHAVSAVGSPLKTSSPNKPSSSAFLSYHNLGLGSSYYPQLSPGKQHQYLHSPEADTSSQQHQQQSQQHLVYHGNSSYNGDMSSDYIQPCHIFQVCC